MKICVIRIIRVPIMLNMTDLYKTALLGTNRMTPSVSTLDSLREMGIETDDATEAVLTGVGMLGLARKAGFPLVDFEGTLQLPCPMETKKYMSIHSTKVRAGRDSVSAGSGRSGSSLRSDTGVGD